MDRLKSEVVTINDIARLSGVAKSTVSRYLNGGSVSVKTRKKIQQIIEETNYSPNSFAQSLKAKKTNLIGTIVPRLDSPSIVESLAGMDKKLVDTGYDLLILNTYQNHEREISAVETFIKQKVAGIILFATQIDNSYYELLNKVSVPVIVVGQEVPKLHNILYSDYQAGYDVGKYISQSGHTKVVYLGVSEKDIAVGINRKQGLIEALDNSKVTVDCFETTFKTQDAYQLALKLLPKSSATYFACATDNIALGVLKAALELGIKLPKDISVSGFGGSSSTDAVSPTITTMKYHYERAGELAVESLISLLNNNHITREVWIPAELKIKESTRNLSLG